jgi:hypothetical protein
MKRVNVASLAGVLLFIGGNAFAQAEDPAAPPPDPNAAAPAAPAAGGSMMGWTDAVINRPLTMPKGKVGIYGDLDVARISVTVAGMTASATSEGLHAGFGYGVDDKLEIGAEYALSLHDFEAKGPLTLYGAYSLYHEGKLTIGASADLVVDFNGAGAIDPVTMQATSSTNLALEAGLGVRYMLTDKIAAFTGSPIAPGPLGQHLHIGLNNSGPISIDLPVGVALQATPQLYAYIETNIAHIKLANSSNAIIFADDIPLTIGALFAASHNLDVGAFLNLPDLENSQFDVLVFGLQARYYM